MRFTGLCCSNIGLAVPDLSEENRKQFDFEEEQSAEPTEQPTAEPFEESTQEVVASQPNALSQTAPKIRSCLCLDPSILPFGYGDWEDWNHPFAIVREEQLALEHDLSSVHRGPNPEHPNSPCFWKNIPFDSKKQVWGCWSRTQLPRDYTAITDWYSDLGLLHESQVARRYHIAWSLRGPPNGPPSEGPKMWRGMIWRPSTEKWMSRAGKSRNVQKYKIQRKIGF